MPGLEARSFKCFCTEKLSGASWEMQLKCLSDCSIDWCFNQFWIKRGIIFSIYAVTKIMAEFGLGGVFLLLLVYSFSKSFEGWCEGKFTGQCNSSTSSKVIITTECSLSPYWFAIFSGRFSWNLLIKMTTIYFKAHFNFQIFQQQVEDDCQIYL